MAVKFVCKDEDSDGTCLRKYSHPECEYTWQCNTRVGMCSTCRNNGTKVCDTCDIKTCSYNDGC